MALCRSKFRKFSGSFRILHYCRYVDNLIFVVQSSLPLEEVSTRLVDELKVGLGPYAGKLEENGAVGVKFLDMYMYKGPRFRATGRLDVKPLVKAVGRYLNLESHHPVAVHLAWPLAYVKRLWTRSSSLECFEEAKLAFLERLQYSQWPLEVVAWVSRCTVYFRPFQESTCRSSVPRKRTLWQPLLYNRALSPALSRTLKEFMDNPRFRLLLDQLLEEPAQIDAMFCWKLHGSAFGTSLVQW